MTALVLGTASYWSFRPDMGVPVRTSIGQHPDFRHAPQVSSLAPWGVFRKLEHLPIKEQAAAYRASLWRRQDRVWSDLAALGLDYPDVPLILLCWCSSATALDGACHRRWAADWFFNSFGLQVDEWVTGSPR